ncbi:MAG: SET domain-containing protein [Saprospiraceae bacterium]
MSTRLPFLYIMHIEGKGRGVFTAEPIPEGSSIESCPVIVVTADDTERIHQTLLHDYYFLWGDDGSSAVALGYGSLYNHSSSPNADYGMDYDNLSIEVFALRDIAAGEEITFNYTDASDQRTTLWFDEN